MEASDWRFSVEPVVRIPCEVCRTLVVYLEDDSIPNVTLCIRCQEAEIGVDLFYIPRIGAVRVS